MVGPIVENDALETTVSTEAVLGNETGSSCTVNMVNKTSETYKANNQSLHKASRGMDVPVIGTSSHTDHSQSITTVNGGVKLPPSSRWASVQTTGGNDSDSSNDNSSVDQKHFITANRYEEELLLPASSREFSRACPKNKVVKNKHILEKIVFVISVSTLIIMAYGILNMHWLLPYYYSISTPVLIFIRIYMYFKNKWQYFLLDFCYFGNIMCYIYIWASPPTTQYAVVIFAVANGPLAWATWMFRNSLVFHDTDRMTSVYIHVLPLFLTYSIRWNSNTVSQHWYAAFPTVWNEEVSYMFIWIVAVPMACFIVHSLLYILIVNVICKPSKEYLNSFRYLANNKSWQGKMINLFGPKCDFLMYMFYNWLYCFLSLLFAIVWYKYWIAHTVYLVFVMLLVTWNGSSFYIDVFSVRGFKAENV